ncbi:hypothetical protein CAOG_08825 [Capsaspora owczarzaki ATCC 30864]|uniref:hypothetical protein n=1 Tax=Capsaspora owczarzaki (strain ATCC 30864) TaxID=595528 RepID=UPI0003521F7D|nr:hypothetical protein CAOG_08825 [Capsaspora owczarzaki ATCC 30864]|eukprot:XP_011270465.1 hypothetical protein CAOG_08825 [Capsaspora owczarzaki ATCC 30864]
MERQQVVELLLQFLNENGFVRTQAALEAESRLRFEPDQVKVASQLQVILDLYEATHGDPSKKPRKMDISDLLVQPTATIPTQNVFTVQDLHTGPVLAARLRDDMKLFTGSSDKTAALAQFSDLDDEYRWYRDNTLTHHSGAVLAVEFHPLLKNIALTSSMDRSHQIVDIETGDVLQTFADHTKFVVRVQWSPNGEYFATASYDHHVGLYRRVQKVSKPVEDDDDSDAEEEPAPFKFERVGHFLFEGYAEALCFSPEGDELCMAARNDCFLHFVELTSGNYERSKMNMNALGDTHVSFTALDVSYSPFGKKYLLVCTDKNRLILYARETGEQLRHFYGTNNDEWSTPRHCWHPSGQYIFATSQDRCIYIWEMCSQKLVGKLTGHTENIRDLSFNDKHKILVSTGFDKVVRFWK